MHIHLSNDGTPRYLQIVNQVKLLVASGRLTAGEELPTIRALAEQLSITPNTVARAYRELEQDGLVVKRGTTGTFVSDGGTPLRKSVCRKILEERLDAILAEAHQMKFSTEELIQLLQQRDQQFRSKREES